MKSIFVLSLFLSTAVFASSISEKKELYQQVNAKKKKKKGCGCGKHSYREKNFEVF